MTNSNIQAGLKDGINNGVSLLFFLPLREQKPTLLVVTWCMKKKSFRESEKKGNWKKNAALSLFMTLFVCIFSTPVSRVAQVICLSRWIMEEDAKQVIPRQHRG